MFEKKFLTSNLAENRVSKRKKGFSVSYVCPGCKKIHYRYVSYKKDSNFTK